MVTLLARFIIKDYEEIKEPRVRQSYGMLCGILGIILNLILFAGKGIAGYLSGSIAIVADAFNNLSDAGASIISFFGFKLSMQEADKDHPFGHGRFEYIAGLMVACAILFMSLELFKSAVEKIIHPSAINVNAVTISILSISIVVKLYMAFYNHKISKKIESTAMKATATDSISDCVATSVVLITSIIGVKFDIYMDGYCGILVAVFVLIAGINAAKDTISPLLGQPPSKEFVDSIYRIIMEFEPRGVIGVHDLVVHDYGPGRVMISVHVEVPASGNVLELHSMIDLIEHNLRKELRCEAVIHMDPVSEDDELISSLKEQVKEIITTLDDTLRFHDFRVVTGPDHTNLIFDIVIPFDFKLSDKEVKEYIQEKVSKISTQYFCVIEIDKEYVSY